MRIHLNRHMYSVLPFGDTFLVKLAPTCFRYQLLRSTCEATTRDFILHILIGYLIGYLS
jgi:hypothetical protein